MDEYITEVVLEDKEEIRLVTYGNSVEEVLDNLVQIKNIKYVKRVVPQESIDHTDNLKKYKPDILVHGDDWKKGPLKPIRAKAIKTLRSWGGKLVEHKYTKNISISLMKKKLAEIGNTADVRRAKLKRLIEAKDIVRLLESHNALTGIIIEKLIYK